MIEMVTAAIQLATVVTGFISNEQMLKYAREMKDLQDELIEELAKGQKQDDGKVETLHAKIKNTMAAFQNQLALAQAGKGVAPAAPTQPVAR